MIPNDQELDIEIQQLQELGWGNGGFFTFFTIPNENNAEPFHVMRDFLLDEERIKKNFIASFPVSEKIERIKKDMEQFKLLVLDDWEQTTREKLVEWMNFKNTYSPANIDENAMEEGMAKFLKNLKLYLLENKLATSYLIDELFDDYNTPWGDQMSSNLVYEVKDKIHVLHFGWSS